MTLRSPLASPVRRVLLVGGDEDARAGYAESFTHAGFEVVSAADGREALTRALTHPPAVIVTELHLLLIDAVPLCEILRTDRATARIPIVILTDDQRPAELERILRAGADDVLFKPIATDALVTKVSELITEAATNARLGQQAVRADGRAGLARSAELLARAEERRTTLAKAHRREGTVSPPLRPPALKCPTCDRTLTYQFSHIGGVSERHPEQWDYLSCSSCGGFQYRQRTRRIRRLTETEEQWARLRKPDA